MSANSSCERTVRCYIGALAVVALLLFAGWLYLFGASPTWTVLVAGCVLAAVAAASRAFPVSLGIGKTSLEAADAAILVALILGGPLCGLVAAIPPMLYRDRLRTAFQAANYAMQVLTAGMVLALFSEPLLSNPSVTTSFVFGSAAAGLALFSVDALVGAVLLRMKYATPVADLLKEFVLAPVPSDILTIFTALATSLAVAHYGPVAALTLFCGSVLSLVAINLAVRYRKRVRGLAAENAELREGWISSNLEFATRLVASLGSRDGFTARHAAASAVYAADVARELGLDSVRARKVELAALLQNVGLVSVPDEVLQTAPGKLNSLGRMHLERHPVGGEEMLAAVPGLEEAAKWVRWHHEREDGTGYPDRLRGEWIPLEARILATTELYASLVLDGPHSPAAPPHEARRELIGHSGTGLDGGVVRTFLRVLDSNDENYASAADDRFAFPITKKVRPEGEILPLRPTGTDDSPR